MDREQEMELMIRRMDAPLLTQFITEIPSAAATVPQSKLYSSWSVCVDDAGAPSTWGHKDESSPVAFSEEPRSSVIGSESRFLEEDNDRDGVTDWNSLSRLFPPLWATADHHHLSESTPSMASGRPDFPSVLSPPLYEESGRKLPDMESLHRGFEDLGLLDNWISSPKACSAQVEDFLKDLYIENPALDLSTSLQPMERTDQCMDRLNPSANAQSQKGPQEYAGVHRPWCRDDKTKGRFMKQTPVGPKNRSGMRDSWDKDLYGRSAGDFTPLSVHTPAYYNPRESTHRMPYSGAPDSFSTFLKVDNFNYRETPLLPSEGFHQKWLEMETARNENQASSPLPSPVGSTMSDGSPTHHPGHFSGIPLAKKEGQQNGPPYQENRRKAFSHLSPSKEGVYCNTPQNYPPNWSPPQQTSAPGRPERYAKKPSSPITNTERRGRRGWNPQYGKPIPPIYSGFQRKQDPSVGNMSDFINASFLPSFSLMADLKQSQNLPFNHPSFSPPSSLPFPPPFPYSDLIDLFHCDDLGPFPPFISDLFCSDAPPPFLPFPAPFNKYRPSRNRSGPANELHMQLEECCEQWRVLEKERKKTEAELAVKFPGHRISCSYSSTIPRLPPNPSRVDRLVVDQFREQARAVSLVKIMERIRGETLHVNIHIALEHHLEAVHLTQARRKDEIINAANRQKQGVPRYNNERDVLALAAAIKEMVLSTRRARTALWCSLQMTLSKSSSGVTVKQEDIERALQELCPAKPPSTEVELHADIGFGSGRGGSTLP
ncbi:uncharacterized protein LOC143781275 isoform X2 [Ranitomeya variabilis]|uniref:uncharacterized protein LOC143781275 isoform X2 n=2 Tax=Ranitomeya variabilis TaxID=490064 RepID=UPI004056D03F